MLTVYSSNIVLYPISHNFPIDIRALCDRPGIKCASFPLYGKLGNAIVRTMFDGSLLMHADENG